MATVVEGKDGVSIDDPPITVVLGSPEAVFGVHTITGTSSNTKGAMTTGEWLVDRDGRTVYGALGVFIDTAIGSPAVAHRPHGAWAVTTDLSITFCGAPAVSGGDLRSASRTVFVDHRSAVSEGEVINPNGQVVAKVVERVLFTPDQPISDSQVSPGSIDRTSGDVITLLGGARHDDAVLLDIGQPSLNPAGALHGGVAVYMSERAASSMVDGHVEGLTPTALQMSYIRPGPAGSRLIFRCVPIHMGRNSAMVRVEARTLAGKVCTVAAVTYHRR